MAWYLGLSYYFGALPIDCKHRRLVCASGSDPGVGVGVKVRLYSIVIIPTGTWLDALTRLRNGRCRRVATCKGIVPLFISVSVKDSGSPYCHSMFSQSLVYDVSDHDIRVIGIIDPTKYSARDQKHLTGYRYLQSRLA